MLDWAYLQILTVFPVNNLSVSYFYLSQGFEKKCAGLPLEVRGALMSDITALSCAYSPDQSVLLRILFFAKWENHESQDVKALVGSFKREWCNARVGNWTHGHIHNYVNNTNGLESTNKVLKDEVTQRQLMPILNFLIKIQLWLGEQSAKREVGNPNYMQFATTHTFSTLNWTTANAWRLCKKKQIRILQEYNVYVTMGEDAVGTLTHDRAVTYYNTFTDSSWATYDEFTTMYFNMSIVRVDHTRPEGYRCSCIDNCKTFTCVHSLAVAMIRGTMAPPANIQINLLGRKRRRGRRPQAAPAWERMVLDINSPVAHPQQDEAVLAGHNVGENLLPELQEEV